MLEFIGLIDAAVYNATGFLFVALGLLVSIRFTGYPDLTTDGSFTIGAATYAVSVVNGIPIIFALFLSAAIGAASGCLTAALNQILNIGKIISSVIVMLFLILVTPYLAGGASIGLINVESLFIQVSNLDLTISRTLLPDAHFSLHLVFISIVVVILSIVFVAIYKLFKSRTGLAIRYVGSAISPNLLSQTKQKTSIFIGLMIGNSLISVGGAIEAERNGGFSQNMGMGVILIGVTILVLGESILKSRTKRDNLFVNQCLLACLIGTIVYCIGVQLILSLDLSIVDIRLATTIFLLFLLIYVSRRHPNSSQFF